MQWPVKIELPMGSKIFIDAIFSVDINGNDVYFSYGNQLELNGFYYFDSLAFFNRIEFDSENSLLVKFISNNYVRTIEFQKEIDLQHLWTTLNNYVNITQLSCSKRTFSISSKTQTFSFQSLFPRSSSISRTKDKNSSNLNSSESNSICIPTSISYKSLFSLNQSSFEKYKQQSIPVFQMDISSDIVYHLWLYYLNIDTEDKLQNRMKEYFTIKSHWYPMDKEIWNKNLLMRIYVQKLEQQIFQSLKPKNNSNNLNNDERKIIEIHQNILFNILFSFYNIQLKPISYKSYIFSIVDFLFKSVVVVINSNGTIMTSSSDLITQDETEAIIFTLFMEFYNQYIDQTSKSFKCSPFNEIYSDTITILQEQSPTTIKLLKNFQINSFDFILPILDSCFLGREIEQLFLIFTEIISTKNPKLIFPCAIATSLILLQNQLAQLPKKDLFYVSYESGLQSIDYRLWLANIDKFINISIDEST